MIHLITILSLVANLVTSILVWHLKDDLTIVGFCGIVVSIIALVYVTLYAKGWEA